jgi:hypothetical protein
MRASVFTMMVIGLGTAAWARSPTTAEIERAWAERERRLASGSIEWSEQVLNPRGSLSWMMTEERVFPELDTTTTETKTFAWDGARMSYRMRGDRSAVDQSAFVPFEHRSVVGGKTGSRSLGRNQSVAYPMGTVLPPGALENREDIELIPAMLWARPLDARGAAIDIVKARLRGDRPVVDGRPCAVLEERKPGGRMINRWFIDDGRGFAVLRYEVEVGGNTKIRVDLTYEDDATLGPVPKGWRTLWFTGKGNLQWERTATVVARAVPFRPGEGEFELDFPAGAWVHDRIRGVSYLVTSDGQERVVNDSELARGASYRDLLDSEEGLGGLPRPPRWREWVLTAAAALLVLSLTAAAVRKFRASRFSH